MFIGTGRKKQASTNWNLNNFLHLLYRFYVLPYDGMQKDGIHRCAVDSGGKYVLVSLTIQCVGEGSPLAFTFNKPKMRETDKEKKQCRISTNQPNLSQV